MIGGKKSGKSGAKKKRPTNGQLLIEVELPSDSAKTQQSVDHLTMERHFACLCRLVVSSTSASSSNPQTHI
jgi:hypothetical protein